MKEAKTKEKPTKFIRLVMQLIDTKHNRKAMESVMRQMKTHAVQAPHASIKYEHISRMMLATTPNQKEEKKP